MLCLILAGCGKGLDANPDFSNIQAYKARIDQDFAAAKPEEAAAFNFSVTNLSYEQYKQQYSGTTYRKAARTELEKYLALLQAQLAAAEKQKPEFEKRNAELSKVRLDLLGNELTHNTFFDRRNLQYRFRITNGSSIQLSKVQLVGTFSINGKPEALYQWEPVITFDNGLRPGESAVMVGEMLGFGSFDRPITLAVREAKSREVSLVVTDLANFSEQWLIGPNSPLDQLNTLPGRIDEVKRHLSNI
jgi:hypothetical protein